jgi:hypothetical protein
MKDFPGLPFASLPGPEAPDFTRRLRDMLSIVDFWARDASAGFGRVVNGQLPNGSGGVLGVTDHGDLTGLGDDDHAQYLLLTGRSAGQELLSNATGQVTLTVSPLSGQTANQLEWSDTAGTSRAAVLPTGVIVAGKTTADVSSPLGTAVFNANGRSSFPNAIRATATGSGDAALHAVCGTTGTYALRVALGAVSDNAGIFGSGAAGFGSLPNANTAVRAVGVGGSVGNTYPVSTVTRNSIGATDNLSEWRSETEAVLSRITSAGAWDGPINSASAATFNNAGTAQIACVVDASGSYSGLGLAISSDLAFFGEFQVPSGGLTANRFYAFPDASGAVLLGGVSATIVANTSSTFASSVAAGGASFMDSALNTRRLRMVLSGAVGNNSFTFTNTAARNYGFGNLSGNVVIAGDDAPAVASGNLGKVDLTAQAADITTTNLSSTPPAGMYLVDVVLLATASDAGAGTLTLTIGWTDTLGATTDATVTLALTATGRAKLLLPIQVASGDITYAVTGGGTYGTARFAVYVRVLSLG